MDCQATLSISVTQCDAHFHYDSASLARLPATVQVSCPAKRLSHSSRSNMAVQVLTETETVSPSWPASTRSAGSSSTNRCTPRNGARQCLRPALRSSEVLLSTCRLPEFVGCGNWSWPWCSVSDSSTRGVVEDSWPTSSIFGSPWGPYTTSCTAPLLRPGGSTSSAAYSTIVIGLLDRDLPARGIPFWWGSMPNPPSASC